MATEPHRTGSAYDGLWRVLSPVMPFAATTAAGLAGIALGAARGGLPAGAPLAVDTVYASLSDLVVGGVDTAGVQTNGQTLQVPPNAHEGFLDPARKRVLVGLLVGVVARSNQLRLDPKRLNETLRLIASTYEEPEQVIELYRNDPQLMSGLQNRVMEEQVIDWIAERAQHTELALSFQEAIRQ